VAEQRTVREHLFKALYRCAPLDVRCKSVGKEGVETKAPLVIRDRSFEVKQLG